MKEYSLNKNHILINVAASSEQILRRGVAIHDVTTDDVSHEIHCSTEYKLVNLNGKDEHDLTEVNHQES